ncbi:MAG: hypothetical protein KIT84_03805 [Labilithrix sp.]|nr:hypothetical protein [Labilithrix sp.]MCW5810109.1 hypothetical protein [Labilithrix sp.]
MKHAVAGRVVAVVVACSFACGVARAEKPGAVVVGSALSVPVGRATGATGDGVRELLGNASHTTIGARLHLAPRARLAIDAGLEIGQAGPAMRRVCFVYDATCLLLGGTLSLDVEVPLVIRRGWELWAREGVGVEIVAAGAVTDAPEVMLIGFDHLRPGVGVDFRVSERHRLGVFTQASIGTYAFVRTTSDPDGAPRGIGDQGVHARLALGARWVIE